MDPKRPTITLLMGLLFGLVATGTFAQGVVLSKSQEAMAAQLHKSIFDSSPFNRERLVNLASEERSLLLNYYWSYIEQRKREGQTDESLMNNNAVHNLALLGDDWAREMVVRVACPRTLIHSL